MPEAKADPRARLIFDRAELKYNFGAQHPLQPDRLVALIGVPVANGQEATLRV